MSNSYKFYSDTKDIMKKYVNATEGAIIYGISKSRIMVLASEAGAVYKVGNSALINTDGRMIEIYLYVSVAPVPCATVTNREWGTIGTNYFKGLCALAFQGFFMMVCVAIYAVLVAGVAVADNLHTALWSVAAYTVILCFSLFKTGSLSKSIWNAH